MSTAKKPSPEQAFVLAKLAASNGQIAYYRGGFWSTPGQQTSVTGAPSDWHTTKGTVEAMERRGWLTKLPTGSNYDPARYPGLNDRTLTDAGRALVA